MIPPLNLTCETCSKQYFAFCGPVGPKTCPSCQFVIDALAGVKTSCGEYQFSSQKLWLLTDAEATFAERGWSIDLHQPSPREVRAGRLTMTIKAATVQSCKGKAESPAKCHATACGVLPDPERIHAIKQSACRSSCPVADPAMHTVEIDALTHRCCVALSTITVDPVNVQLTAEDVPALLGAVRKLKGSNWAVSLSSRSGRTPRKSVGSIQISPSLSASI